MRRHRSLVTSLIGTVAVGALAAAGIPCPDPLEGQLKHGYCVAGIYPGVGTYYTKVEPPSVVPGGCFRGGVGSAFSCSDVIWVTGNRDKKKLGGVEVTTIYLGKIKVLGMSQCLNDGTEVKSTTSGFSTNTPCDYRCGL